MAKAVVAQINAHNPGPTHISQAQLVTFLQVRCGSASRVWHCDVSVWCYRLAGRPECEECASANFQPARSSSVQ